jgi:hypothetical protein
MVHRWVEAVVQLKDLDGARRLLQAAAEDEARLDAGLAFTQAVETPVRRCVPASPCNRPTRCPRNAQVGTDAARLTLLMTASFDLRSARAWVDRMSASLRPRVDVLRLSELRPQAT